MVLKDLPALQADLVDVACVAKEAWTACREPTETLDRQARWASQVHREWWVDVVSLVHVELMAESPRVSRVPKVPQESKAQPDLKGTQDLTAAWDQWVLRDHLAHPVCSVSSELQDCRETLDYQENQERMESIVHVPTRAELDPKVSAPIQKDLEVRMDPEDRRRELMDLTDQARMDLVAMVLVAMDLVAMDQDPLDLHPELIKDQDRLFLAATTEIRDSIASDLFAQSLL